MCIHFNLENESKRTRTGSEQVLKPTEIAVLELSKEPATLMTAEGVFKFLELFEQRAFARQQRCDDVDGVSSDGYDDFTYCSKTAMMSFTKKFVSHKTWQQN
jgi:hypothetical protein